MVSQKTSILLRSLRGLKSNGGSVASTIRCAALFILAILALPVALLNPLHARPAKSPNLLLKVDEGVIDVSLPDEEMKLSQQELEHWIKTCANAVSRYYGHFPVHHLTLKIRSGRGSSVRHGVTYPANGGLIVITVGQEAGVEDLNNDWMLTHEMIHLAFPSMADNHHWIEEGISTYVEPVARAQAGWLSPEEVWRDFIRDMPQGEPKPGDQGLDYTPTWGRTYWGGALFCLVADVRIRERTKNRKGLQDALRAIWKDGGVITEDWEIEKTLSLGDKATGTDVLMSLYREMRDKPAAVDLDELWKKLGAGVKGDGAIQFNDHAVDSALRQAITAARDR